MRSWPAAVILGTVLAQACGPQQDASKDTPESRCQRICTPAASGPCNGKTEPSCSSACVARLAGKSDACQSCLQSKSGWKGVSCSCDDALGGFGSATCKTCKWTGAQSACTTEISGSCSGAQGCEGLTIAPVGEPDCAAPCNEQPIADAGSTD